jgi:hypothetical protein
MNTETTILNNSKMSHKESFAKIFYKCMDRVHSHAIAFLYFILLEPMLLRKQIM